LTASPQHSSQPEPLLDRRYDAVVFDFFGTLTINSSRAERRAGAGRIAAVLGVDPDEYFEQVTSTFSERATGAAGDLEATIRWLAQRCGLTPDTERVSAAADIRRTVEGGFIRNLRPEAVEIARSIKALGIRIGVLSDCTHELPMVWPSLPIAECVDAAVFSIEEGKRKPDPDLFAAVTSRLGVPPDRCLYIGDGGGGELTGATKAGMTAYLLHADDTYDSIVYDRDSAWTGPGIGSLTEVLGLLA
jgi:putative hydrolase of the HAD superfamily